MSREPTIARGRSRSGRSASSPEVEIASKPMYAKEISAAASTIPPVPNGAKGLKWAPSKGASPSPINMTRMRSFVRTDDRVGPRALAHADEQHRRHAQHEGDGRQVD